MKEDIDPDIQNVFNIIDYCYTGVYTLELLFNLFGHWGREFLESYWNLLDTELKASLVFTVVVSVSLILIIVDVATPDDESGGPKDSSGFSMNTVRLVRVFKVVRIFGRLKALNVILKKELEYRLVRVFKVVRIFGRLKALNVIFKAIGATIIPVLNSCILVGT
ncbi:hypothetical protein T484DRAFT_1807058 [Baffinella frigidus]|nr:hypothetical protein T484DRAFT_1807058 [Cryptophyta sp. CCMP2293]